MYFSENENKTASLLLRWLQKEREKLPEHQLGAHPVPGNHSLVVYSM